MSRVFAIRDSTETVVYTYGIGEYVGDEIPPGRPQELPEAQREVAEVLVAAAGQEVTEENLQAYWRASMSNPKIHLDSGWVVWGYQCWWGSEERLDELVNGRSIEEVPPPEGNEKWKDN